MDTIRRISALLGLAFALLASIAARADSFTYDVNFFGLSGNIVASCDSCALNSSDVTAWAFSGQGISINSTMAGAELRVSGTSLRATPSLVSYVFSPESSDSAVFWANNASNGNSVNLLSFPTDASEGFEDVGEVDVCYASSIVYSSSSSCLGGGVSGTQTIATIAKSTVKAPELDPRALATSLLLLLGSMSVLKGRRVRAERL